MTYTSKITLKFDSTFEQTGGIYDNEIVPDEHITFECAAHDLNAITLFHFFQKFALAMGHSELGIAKGACHLAFNEMRSVEDMRKTADDYDLVLKEDFSKKIDEYENDVYQLTNTICDLRSKLSRFENPEVNENNKENLLNKLKRADVVCHDCGRKYGDYSVDCSSSWEGKCNVCGETKSVTETRDYNFLSRGIKEMIGAPH